MDDVRAMKRIRVTIRANVIDSCSDWSWLIADWQYTAVIATKYGLRSDYRLSSSTLTNSRVLERYPVMGWTTSNSGWFVCIVHPADVASNFLTLSLSLCLLSLLLSGMRNFKNFYYTSLWEMILHICMNLHVFSWNRVLSVFENFWNLGKIQKNSYWYAWFLVPQFYDLPWNKKKNSFSWSKWERDWDIENSEITARLRLAMTFITNPMKYFFAVLIIFQMTSRRRVRNQRFHRVLSSKWKNDRNIFFESRYFSIFPGYSPALPF